MGASQSQRSDRAGASASAPPGRDLTDDGIDKQDFYALLGLEIHATTDEVKRAYRKLALRYHPDKNPDNVEAANDRFRLISAAYEVLSDDQERAWYDSHRDSILRGETEGDDGQGYSDEGWDEDQFRQFKSGKAQPSSPGSNSPGLTSRHLLRFLDPTFVISLPSTGTKADSDAGFFGVFRRLFERLLEEDRMANPYPGEPSIDHVAYPTFGYSHTAWAHSKAEETQTDQTTARDFYQAWSGYSSRKSFSWRDGWKLSEAPDRRVKKMMEKDNKKARDAGRKEYNETVRSLAAFLRKRDPRWKAHQAVVAGDGTGKASELELARRRAEAEAKARVEAERAAAYVPQEWERQAPVEVDSEFESDGTASEVDHDHSEQKASDASSVSTESEEHAQPTQQKWQCVACDKVFKSKAAWESHERSKKHRLELARLKREMRKQDKELGLDRSVDPSREHPSLAADVANVDLQDYAESSEESVKDDENVTPVSKVQPGQANTQPLSKKARAKLKKRQQRDALLVDDTFEQKEEEVDPGSLPGSSSPKGAAPLKTAMDEEKPMTFTSEGQSASSPKSANKAERRSRKKEGRSKLASEACNVCGEGFESRSKLFNHVRESGHARANISVNDESIGNAPRKGSKSKAAQSRG